MPHGWQTAPPAPHTPSLCMPTRTHWSPLQQPAQVPGPQVTAAWHSPFTHDAPDAQVWQSWPPWPQAAGSSPCTHCPLRQQPLQPVHWLEADWAHPPANKRDPTNTRLTAPHATRPATRPPVSWS